MKLFTLQITIIASFSTVKRSEREADHWPTSNTEVKNACSYTSTPQYVFMARCLVEHRDNSTVTLQI
jgi:hypothetical protein